MRFFVSVALLLTLGCATSKVTVLDNEGKPVVFEQKFGGRGCIAITRDKEGKIDIVIAQDGSSDWASVRAVPITAQAVLSVFFGTRSSENAGFTGPSAIGGCDALFAGPQPDED